MGPKHQCHHGKPDHFRRFLTSLILLIVAAIAMGSCKKGQEKILMKSEIDSCAADYLDSISLDELTLGNDRSKNKLWFYSDEELWGFQLKKYHRKKISRFPDSIYHCEYVTWIKGTDQSDNIVKMRIRYGVECIQNIDKKWLMREYGITGVSPLKSGRQLLFLLGRIMLFIFGILALFSVYFGALWISAHIGLPGCVVTVLGVGILLFLVIWGIAVSYLIFHVAGVIISVLLFVIVILLLALGVKSELENRAD